MTIKSIRRHFPYRSPKFGYVKHPAKPSGWENTIYYWWWSYLRRNSDYIRCCEAGGIGKHSKTFKDFGDVRPNDFKKWWTTKINGESRGALLFAEPTNHSTVKVLSEGDLAVDTSLALTISLPLSLPKNFLEQRVKKLLKKAHKGKRGTQYAKNSRAKYVFNGQPNIPALRQGLLVYDAIKQDQISGTKRPYWMIAQDLKIVPSSKRVSITDTHKVATNKKNVLTAVVARYKRRVESSIKNAGNGLFP